VSSRNYPSISTLVNAISGGLSDGQASDLMHKISDDLDMVFTQINTGPLPAVSGANLLHINPVNIDSPGDNPPLVESQGKVAFLNVANIFIKNQEIDLDLGQLILKITTTPTKFGRVQTIADGNFLFSSNLSWSGAVFQTDAGNGSGINFTDEIVRIRQRIAGVDYTPITVDATRRIILGHPLNISGAADEILLANNKGIRAANAAASGGLEIARLDANNLVNLGSHTNGTGGDGNISISRSTTANMPTAGATRNGILIINSTTNELCFYTGNLRYKLVGVAF